MQRTSGMNRRWMLIAVLVGVELTIINVARQGFSGDSFGTRADAHIQPARVMEDGRHRMFLAGDHPALTVNIGYADVKIVSAEAPTIDVSAASSKDFSLFGGPRPITATQSGNTVYVAASGPSRGDNRLVTILVPARTSITIIEAGDITMSGMRGNATVKSIGSGSVRIDDYKGPDLRVASKGSISLHAVSANHLDALSSDDGINASELAVHDGSIESDDHVTVAFATNVDTIVRAVADDGAINTVGFLDADQPVSTKKDDDDDFSARTLRLGDGTGHLDVHASDGSITLEK